MKNCEPFEILIKKLIAADISSEEMQRLQEHAAECPDCAGLLEAHESLQQMPQIIGTPEAQDFQQMRQAVLGRIRKTAAHPESRWAFLLKPAYAYSFAALLFVAGLFLGNRVMPEKQSAFLGQIRQVAAANDELRDMENSPYTYSNIRFKKQDGQKIALSFDVTTHLEMVGNREDPLVNEVLAQSLLNEPSVGSRLKAISYANSSMDSRVKQALIHTLQNDQSTAVQMKALQALSGNLSDRDVRQAFITVLQSDQPVTLRLAVIDYLAGQNIDPALWQELQDNPAIDVKLKNVINN